MRERIAIIKVCRCCQIELHESHFYFCRYGVRDKTCSNCRIKSAKIRRSEDKNFLTEERLNMSEFKTMHSCNELEMPWFCDYQYRMEQAEIKMALVK